MRRLQLPTLVLALASVLALAACQGQGPLAGPGDTVDAVASGGVEPPGLWDGQSLLLEGALYVLSGPDAYSADVLEARLPGGELRRLTANPRGFGISALSASDAGIALASAENGSDQLRVLAGGRSALWGRQSAMGPSIDGRGRVLAARGTDTGSATDVYVPGRPRRELLPNDPRDPAAVWGRHGTVLVAAPTQPGPGVATRLQERDVQGRLVRDLGRPGGRFSLLANPYPDRQPVTALRPGMHATGFVLTDDLKRTIPVPSDWDIGCWNPHGTALLVTKGTSVGLWRPGRPRQVTVVGASAVPIFDCAWLTGPIRGLPPALPERSPSG